MNRKVMHPATLFSLVWLIIISLHFIFRFTLLNELFPLSIETLIIFFVGALSFSFGSFLVRFVNKKNQYETKIRPIESIPLSLRLRFFILAIIVIALPFYIQAAYRVFIASNIEDFFVGLRTELSYGEEDIGPLKYMIAFSYVFFSINLYAYFKDKNKVNRIILIICLLVTITYGVFTTGRTIYVMIISAYIGISYLLNKKFSIKKSLWLFGIFIVLFMIVGVLYGKGGDKDDPIGENIYPASQTTAIYLVASLNALEWELNHDFEINYKGNYTLRFFQKVGEQLNLVPNIQVSDKFQEFVFIPYSTNVYTVYGAYINDFGKVYAWSMIGIFGILHSLLHDRAQIKKDIRSSLYYAFLLYPLIMVFFQDQYMSLFSSWIQIVLFTECFFIVNRFFIIKKW